MWRGISLANKCLLLFGGAVVLIILAALGFSFLRVKAIIEEEQHELSRQLVQGWLQAAGEFAEEGDRVKPGTHYAVGMSTNAAATPENNAGNSAAPSAPVPQPAPQPVDPRAAQSPDAGTIVVYTENQLQPPDAAATNDPFVARAWKELSARVAQIPRADPNQPVTIPSGIAPLEVHDSEWTTSGRRYRYARWHPVLDAADAAAADSPTVSRGAMVILDRTASGAIQQALVNIAYFFSAGLISLGLAVMVFYLITTRLILSPVRELKETAERVREGDTTIRAEIQTGDEFEELGETFNQMLEAVTASQQQLRAINASLDLKVNELAERNVALFESNKLKGEFLANVSHELRTPLNSIIGFAELLQEQLERDSREALKAAQASSVGVNSGSGGAVTNAATPSGSETPITEPPVIGKRRRYLENIVTAGRNLLEMINGLLDMAKLEAGRMDVKVEQVNIADLCGALIALIRPLADRGGIELALETGRDLPIVETDPKKLQQVIFNLLSNAVKFTSEKVAEHADGAPTTPEKVTLRAERIFGRASEGAGSEDRIRISVLDTGPGISPEDQERIFEKFQQLDAGHTRRHAGTGLGLAIVKELTSLLQGEVQVDSEVGRGSMFSVILPLRVDTQRAQELKLELAFRGSLKSDNSAQSEENNPSRDER